MRNSQSGRMRLRAPCLRASVLWGVGPHVPYPQGIVHGVCEEVGPVRAELHPRDAVSVALEGHGDLLLAKVPNLRREGVLLVDRRGGGNDVLGHREDYD